MKYIPNTLTVLRFIFIPFIIFFAINNHYLITILLLTLSGLTDILDGYIARKYNVVSDFGKLMDPLSDKATQLAILASLTIKGVLSGWIITVVVVKEFLMIAGASFLYGKDLVVSSKWYGKLSTVLFYAAIVLTMFIGYWNSSLAQIYNFILPNIDIYIYYIAILTTVFSLIMYTKSFIIKGYLKKEDKI